MLRALACPKDKMLFTIIYDVQRVKVQVIVVSFIFKQLLHAK